MSKTLFQSTSNLLVPLAVSGPFNLTRITDLYLASGNITGTLPSAATNIGQLFRVIRTSSTLTDVVTIQRSGGDTIAEGNTTATSTTLNTQGEEIEIFGFDASTWLVLNRRTEAQGTWTPTFSSGFGSYTNAQGFWSRFGNRVIGTAYVTTGTVANAVCSFTLPSGITVATAAVSSVAATAMTGRFAVLNAGGAATTTYFHTFYDGSDATLLFLSRTSASALFVKTAGTVIFGNGDGCAIEFNFPVSGWKG